MSSYDTFIVVAPFLAYVAALTVGFGISHYMLVKKVRDEEEHDMRKIYKIVIKNRSHQ